MSNRQATQKVVAHAQRSARLRKGRSSSTSGETFRLATETRVDIHRVDAHLASLVSPASMEAECYRRLRYSVELAGQDRQCSVFAVCSPAPGDGKTVTSINLAGAMAQNPDARVLLLELDLRKSVSSVARYLGLSEASMRPGVVDRIHDPSLMWGEAVRYFPQFNLCVMAAGRKTSRPYEVLKSRRLAKLVAEARQRYHYVVIDTPPIVLLPDSQLISRFVDGLIVVTTSGVTSRAYLEETLNLADQDKMLGIIFNDSEAGLMRGYYDYAYPQQRASATGVAGRFAATVSNKLTQLVPSRLGTMLGLRNSRKKP